MAAIHIYGCGVDLLAADALSFGNSLYDRFGTVVNMHNDAFAHTLVGAAAVADDGDDVRVERITRADVENDSKQPHHTESCPPVSTSPPRPATTAAPARIATCRQAGVAFTAWRKEPEW